MRKQKNYPYNSAEKFSSIKELLELAEKAAGDKNAFEYNKDGIQKVTYRKFRRTVQALGTALAARGIMGRHVACISENRYEWLVSYLTLLCGEGVFVPVDKELPGGDILNVLTHSDSEAVFCSEKFETLLIENKAEVEKIKFFISFDRAEHDEQFLSFAKLVEEGEKLLDDGNTDYISMTNDEYALKLLVYTSGTTGMAKGVMLTEHNIVSCIYYGLHVANIHTRCLSVLPYNHTYEAVVGILVSLHRRATICINENLRTVAKNLKVYKPDYVFLVPAFAELFYSKIWANIREQKKEKLIRVMIGISNFLRNFGIDLRRKLFKSILDVFGGEMREIVCGGAPIRPEIGKFFDDIGILLIGGYGITECSPLVSVNRERFNDFATVGVKIPCVDVKIEGINEDGNGEICVKGDTVMLGYYKNEEQTNEVLKDGWFYTGDYGYINDNEQIVITGRKKNLIVLSNGKNIYPEEIEGYIMGIPCIKEVIVRGDKDETGAEKSILAEVFLQPEYPEKVDEKQLKGYIDEALKALPGYKQVSKVIIRETEFEKTTSNKIKRKYN